MKTFRIFWFKLGSDQHSWSYTKCRTRISVTIIIKDYKNKKYIHFSEAQMIDIAYEKFQMLTKSKNLVYRKTLECNFFLIVYSLWNKKTYVIN